MHITATTKLIGVIGSPVAHSFSPKMHNAAFESLNLDFCYVALDVKPESLSQGVQGLRALGFRGFNVTIPHKEQIISLLDHVDEEAQIIGAVNTVVNKDGKLIGYNTDGKGFLRSLAEEWDFAPRGENIVILGAGGAARAIATGLAAAGAGSITIANRNLARGLILKTDLQRHYSCNIQVVDLGYGPLDLALAESSLVVQTTPLGMHPAETAEPIIDPARLKPGSRIYDIIFNPQETRFLREARQHGCKAANGLGMLLHQGALAFEYWTGCEAPLEKMRSALFG